MTLARRTWALAAMGACVAIACGGHRAPTTVSRAACPPMPADGSGGEAPVLVVSDGHGKAGRGSAALSSRGLLATAGEREIFLWQAEEGVLLRTLPHAAQNLQFSEDGQTLAVFSGDKVVVLDLEGRAVAQSPAGLTAAWTADYDHTGEVVLAFASTTAGKKGKTRLASWRPGSDERPLALVEREPSNVRRSLGGHRVAITTPRDGNALSFWGPQRGSLRVLDVSGPAPREVKRLADVTDVSPAPGGGFVAATNDAQRGAGLEHVDEAGTTARFPLNFETVDALVVDRGTGRVTIVGAVLDGSRAADVAPPHSTMLSSGSTMGARDMGGVYESAAPPTGEFGVIGLLNTGTGRSPWATAAGSRKYLAAFDLASRTERWRVPDGFSSRTLVSAGTTITATSDTGMQRRDAGTGRLVRTFGEASLNAADVVGLHDDALLTKRGLWSTTEGLQRSVDWPAKTEIMHASASLLVLHYPSSRCGKGRRELLGGSPVAVRATVRGTTDAPLAHVCVKESPSSDGLDVAGGRYLEGRTLHTLGTSDRTTLPTPPDKPLLALLGPLALYGGAELTVVDIDTGRPLGVLREELGAQEQLRVVGARQAASLVGSKFFTLPTNTKTPPIECANDVCRVLPASGKFRIEGGQVSPVAPGSALVADGRKLSYFTVKGAELSTDLGSRILSVSVVPGPELPSHAVITTETSAELVSLPGLERVAAFPGQHAWVSPAGDRLAIMQTSGRVSLHALPSGALLASYLEYADGEWLTLAPSGAFRGTAEARRRLFWKFPSQETHFQFEQFVGTFERPELVRAALAGQAQRPMRASAPPEAQANVALDGAVARVSVQFRSTSRVDKIRAYLEGREVASADVCASSGATNLQVPLHPGQNRLTTIAFDHLGRASKPSVSDVVAPEGTRKPRVWVVAAGISAYEKWPQLPAAAGDAQAIASAFEAQAKGDGLFSAVDASVLLDGRVTQSELSRALERLQGMDPDDLAVVLFAGHGAKTSADGESVLVPISAGMDQASIDREGIRWDFLAERLGKAKGRVLVLLDACHSGHISRELLVRSDDLAASLARAGRAGLVVFAASKGSQLSYEGVPEGGAKTERGLVLSGPAKRAVGPAGRGFFTGAVVQSVASAETDVNGDGRIQLSELLGDVSRRVAAASGELQTPWVVRQEIIGDFSIASAKEGPATGAAAVSRTLTVSRRDGRVALSASEAEDARECFARHSHESDASAELTLDVRCQGTEANVDATSELVTRCLWNAFHRSGNQIGGNAFPSPSPQGPTARLGMSRFSLRWSVDADVKALPAGSTIRALRKAGGIDEDDAWMAPAPAPGSVCAPTEEERCGVVMGAPEDCNKWLEERDQRERTQHPYSMRKVGMTAEGYGKNGADFFARIMRVKYDDMRACVEAAFKGRTFVAGKVSMKVKIARDGTFSSVKAVGTNKLVTGCLERVVKPLSMPSPDGPASGTADYTYDRRPGPKTPGRLGGDPASK